MTGPEDANAPTEPDVGRLRERFDALPQRPSLERKRTLDAVQRALFGASTGPLRVGRFEIDGRLGAGAMGIVYAAHDPQLDRKVAVKVLHPQSDPTAHAENVARLLREAKTLARLTHPNVVTVHEVGQTDDGLFIAMQFVDGATLRQWLDEHRPAWPEILALFMAAGEGLAAAHKQDLVHRDFKPDNVLVDSEGHARVADFGLACSVVDTHARTIDDHEDALGTVTQTGTLLGTPAYMAPELFEGRSADASSDQYAYCVAFYEALFGARPFAGKTLAAIMENARAMKFTAPVEGRDAPSWLRKIVIKGLAPNPRERYPSMRALLTALERGRHRRRRFAIGGVAVLAVVAAGAAYGLGSARSAAARCPKAKALRDAVWDVERRNAVVAAFAADDRTYVAKTADSTLAALDTWAQHWADDRAEACAATHVRAEQSATLLDLRVQCYELARSRMHALVETMTSGSEALEHAPTATRALPDLRLCADPQWVEARKPLPAGAAARERIEALNAQITKAEVLGYAGKLQETIALAEGAMAEAEELDYAPLVAQALRVLARAYKASGRPEDAEAALSRAMTESLGAGDEWNAARAAIGLIDYVGVDAKRTAERKRWATVAEGIITKLGSPPDLEGGLALTQAMALRHEGDPAAALEQAERAVELLTVANGEIHARTAHAHEEMGIALDMLGRPDDGIEHISLSLDIERQVWGDEHPRVGTSILNLGILYAQSGRVDEAAERFAEGLRILEAAYGKDTIMTVEGLTNMGGIRHHQGHYEEALEFNRRAREIRERVYGPDHIDVAINLANGGQDLSALQRFDEAYAWLDKALKIREEKLGEDHPKTAESHKYLVTACAGLGRHDESLVHATKAYEVWKKTFGDTHPLVAAALLDVGSYQVIAGDREGGLAKMREAAAIMEKARGPDHPDTKTVLDAINKMETSSQFRTPPPDGP